MKQTSPLSLAISALAIGAARSFTPALSRPVYSRTVTSSSSPATNLPLHMGAAMAQNDSDGVPLHATVDEENTGSTIQTKQIATTDASSPEAESKPKPAPAAERAPPKKKGGAVHKEGVLSPVVFAAKTVLGEELLNKARAKVISMHSDVIGGFVETADSPFGTAVLKSLFHFADQNKNGKLEKEELEAALKVLGFDWLKQKQVDGIFKRADLDENGAIDLDEWMLEAPKTLRTNLVKLAKKNGGDMGLLV